MNVQRLKSVSILQSAIVMGVLYASFALIITLFLLPIGIISALAGVSQAAESSEMIGGGIGMALMGIFLPILYGALGFVGGAIGAFIYNLVAKVTGGLEFTFASVPPKPRFPANPEPVVQSPEE